jgi:hypothetical protein
VGPEGHSENIGTIVEPPEDRQNSFPFSKPVLYIFLSYVKGIVGGDCVQRNKLAVLRYEAM